MIYILLLLHYLCLMGFMYFFKCPLSCIVYMKMSMLLLYVVYSVGMHFSAFLYFINVVSLIIVFALLFLGANQEKRS